MTPEGRFDAERVIPPDSVNPDRDKTVFDPEIGEWLTINEARQQAEDHDYNEFMRFLGDVGDAVPLRGQGLPRDQYMEQYEEFLQVVSERVPVRRVRKSTADQDLKCFDPVTGEWQRSEEIHRNTALYEAGVEQDAGVGLLVEDIGKKVYSAGRVFLGRVIFVEAGMAYVVVASDVAGKECGVLDRKFVVDKRDRRYLSSQHLSDHDICRISPALVSKVDEKRVHLKDITDLS